jgi:ribonuclease HII
MFMPEKIMGLDEAGRGCVVGPLVMGAVVVSSEGGERLRAIGVRDSKKLSRQRRSELSVLIPYIAQTSCVRQVEPAVIDRYCRHKLLNHLEIEVMASLINEYQPDIVYIDALGHDTAKFIRQIQALLRVASPQIIAEHHADANYPVVSAASIVAKVMRDAAIDALHGEIGDFGSGYPADPQTAAFLREIYRRTRSFPPAVRQSWQTVQRMLNGEQGLLF